MSNLQLLKETSRRIICGGKKGTGFFVSTNTLLTAYHVIKKFHDSNATIELFTHTNQPLNGTVLDFDVECDLALIQVADEFKADDWLTLCECQMVDGLDWHSYGYPDNGMGQLAGEPLKGTVKNILEVPVLKNDMTVEVPGYNITTVQYEGFSGSALVDCYNNAISVMRFSGTNDLGAVSIKRGCAFLKKNAIAVKPDYLYNFDAYEPEIFAGFPETIKTLCSTSSEGITQTLTPDMIATALGGHLFFPKKNLTAGDLIAHLRVNAEVNKLLWTGWLEFLTFIVIMDGAFNLPEITVDIPAVKVLKLVTTKVSLPVRLKYFWTEKDSFEAIARKYIHNKLNDGLPSNSCHVFNSQLQHFGIKLNADFKRKIIYDIGNPQKSGPTIVRKFSKSNADFGYRTLEPLLVLFRRWSGRGRS
jgi:hypothetical protein